MEGILALCDIGNTSIKIGFAHSAGILASYAIPTNPQASPDSLGIALWQFAAHAGIDAGQISAVVAASVVPALNPVLRAAVTRYFRSRIYFVPDDLPVPLENRYLRPAEVGADRLVCAYAARKRYPASPVLLVVDFGTALTFDCVEGAAFLGGLIFPGPGIAAETLARHTARLPQVGLEFEEMAPRPCRDTMSGIRHGLLFGYIALTEGICARLGEQFACPVKVIGTGGFAATVCARSRVFDIVLPGLLLEGLLDLYQARAG